MEQNQESNTESTSVDNQSGVEGGMPDTSNAATQPTGESAAPAEHNPEANESSEEFVKDDEGNEYIPRKAFEARLAKMAEQKHNAQASFIESIKSDPAVRQEFMQALGIQPQAAQPEADPTPKEPSAFDQWAASLPAEHQAHYRGLKDSFMAEVKSEMQAALDAVVSPILSHIGSEKISTFAKTNPDYDRYAPIVKEIILSGRAKNVEDAYILASHKDKIKGVSAAANTRPATPKPPVKGVNPNPQATKSTGRRSLHDTIMQSAKEIGYGQ